MDYLENLVREWYEFQGYFVRQALWVGLGPDGSYDCELDVVAFHPLHRHVVQVEPIFDLLPFAERETHLRTKFDAGKKYLHRLFGIAPQLHIEQIALIATPMAPTHRAIGGGRVMRLAELVTDIVQHFEELGAAGEPVSDQWALIRTLQLAATCRQPPLTGRLTLGYSPVAMRQYDPRSADDS